MFQVTFLFWKIYQPLADETEYPSISDTMLDEL